MTNPSEDFLEFEHLKAKTRNWRNEDDKLSSDCMVVVDDGTESSLVFNVHLRVLSGSSDFFYKIAQHVDVDCNSDDFTWSRNTMHAMEM